MSDIHEYATFFLASLLLAVMKFAGFINWDWWMTGIPAGLAIVLHLFTGISSR